MFLQYVLFWMTVCLLQASLLYLLNIITFRTKGTVIGYRFKVGTAEYKKYQRRTSNTALLITLAVAILLCVLIALQFLTVARKHVPGSMHTMVVGSLLTLGLGFWVTYKMAAMYGQMGGSNMPGSSGAKPPKDDSWLT